MLYIIKKNIYILFGGLFIISSSCSNNEHKFQEASPVDQSEDLVNNEEIITAPLENDAINFSHFNHLYREINFNGKKSGIIHIYSSYPNYDYDIEPNEGFTCVDDVARTIVMLSKYLELFGPDEVASEKMKNLTEFVLQMQNDNGYFNNFLWSDFSINKTYRTSIATLDWWSLRALWGLESAYPFLKSNIEMASRIEIAIEKLLLNIKRDIPIADLSTEFINSIEFPMWLINKQASDQSALLILGLLKNYERTSNNDSKLMIDALAKGIIVMQKGDADNYPYGVFLSWGNMWHAYGNNQAFALLKAGIALNNQEYIKSALLEIDNFYPKLLQNGFTEAFWVEKSGDNYIENERNVYPQIAYGLRPMVWSTTEAYNYLNDEKYLTLAKKLNAWLLGENDAKIAIYNPLTGVCFDGVIGLNEVNKNSGAESTIESLFVLLQMEKYK